MIFDRPLDFDMRYTVRRIMEETVIMRSLSIFGKYIDTEFLMIIARIIYPGSDLSIRRFFQKVYYPWDQPRTDKDELYWALDVLIGYKDQIKIDLLKTLKPDISVVHYDLT